MRLTRFSVTGYKNLRVPIVLDELAGVNVIHGENNVGKSNLLQAIDLLFWLLRRFAHKPPSDVRSADDPSNLAFDVDRDALVARGFGTDDIFNFDQPLPIVLEAVVKIDDEDWNRIGRSTDRPAQVSVALVVKPSREGDTRVSVTFDDHQPRAQPSRLTEEEDADVGGLPTLQEQQTDLRRTVPSHLLLRLYDAKESVEPGVFQRWEVFERAMNSLTADERLAAYKEALEAGMTLYGRAPDFDGFLRNQRKGLPPPEALQETLEQFLVQIAALSQY